jgi:copper(I)-binding protein
MSFKLLAFAGVFAAASAVLAQTNQLEVSNAWARATPAKAENGVTYVTILSPTPDRLLSASSPAAKKAELHTMEMVGMVMKMRPIAGLDIPAGQPVALKPGGEHDHADRAPVALRRVKSFILT